jgi:hypothetical protein
MGEALAVGALKEKRAELSGIIVDLEKQINRHRADLVISMPCCGCSCRI